MVRQIVSVAATAVTVVALASVARMADPPPAGTATGEWRFYSGDNGSKKYSPIDQINKDTVGRLKIAWRRPALSPDFAAANPQIRPTNNFRATPIMVNGVLYASNAVGLAEAFDPETGKTLWSQKAPPEGLRGSTANRGLAFWSSGNEARVLTYTNSFLYALDPKTGEPFHDFGAGGRVDLVEGLGPLARTYRWNSTPLVVRDVVVMGSSMADQDSASKKEGVPGDVRAYDVRTGKLRWTFKIVPRPGEEGNDTWEDDAWAFTGAGDVWALMGGGAGLAHAYLPTTSS